MQNFGFRTGQGINVRQKIFLVLSLLLLVTLALNCWHSIHLRKEQQQDSFSRYGRQLQESFQAEQEAAEMRMLQIATFVASDPQIQQLFLRGRRAVNAEGGGAGGRRADQVRWELYRRVASGQASLAQKYGFRQLHFHLVPGSLSFLRVHSPEKFGDRMDQVRFTVVEANRTLSETSGFETGRVVSGIRGVVPVFAYDQVGNREVHVGALEAGVAYANLFALFKQNHPDLDIAVLLDEKHLKERIWPEFYARLQQDSLFRNGLMVEATTSPLVEALLSDDLSSGHGTRLRQLHGNDFAVTSFPLRDFQGELDPRAPHAGRVLIWRSVDEEMALLGGEIRGTVGQAVILFVLLDILLYYGVRLTTRELQRELQQTREIKQVTQQAAALTRSINDHSGSPQLHLQRALQQQLHEAVQRTGAELGLYLGEELGPGHFRMLALAARDDSLLVHSSFYQRSREALQQQGNYAFYSSCSVLSAALGTDRIQQFIPAADSILFSAAAVTDQPALHNVLLVPVRSGEDHLGCLILANRADGFGMPQELLARAYVSAAGLIIHADRREIARLAAEESSQLKSEFLSNMSHELRTPLNSIISLGSLLADHSTDPGQQGHLETLNSSARRLATLIDEILLLVELDTRQAGDFPETSFSPAQLVARVVELFQPRICNRDLKLHAVVDDAIPGQLWGHPEQLELVLRQLVGNAIKFSGQGDICLKVGAVTDDQTNWTLQFEVHDQGPGVSYEQLECIFEPFVQGDGSRTRAHDGAGLGLTIARKVCQLLNTDLQAVSRPGHGARF